MKHAPDCMRFCLAGIVIFAAVCLRFSGCLLVLNNGVSSDVAVAEGGDDRSYWAALAALRRGEVRYVLLDLSSPDVDDDLDSDTRSFLARTAPDCADRILSNLPGSVACSLSIAGRFAPSGIRISMIGTGGAGERGPSVLRRARQHGQGGNCWGATDSSLPKSCASYFHCNS
jgi:hypothetical protein